MKKLLQNVFVRSISGILCIAALLGILISSLGIFFLWNFEDQDKWYREGREKLLENYAMYAFDHMKDEGLAGKLENTNVYISIVRKDGELEETVLSTMPAGKKAEFTTESNILCFILSSTSGVSLLEIIAQ